MLSNPQKNRSQRNQQYKNLKKRLTKYNLILPCPFLRILGNALRDQREKLSLAIEDISAHTKIRKNYLQILEAGRFDEFPSPMQARVC